jgi:transcription elongation factor GreA-like protein
MVDTHIPGYVRANVTYEFVYPTHDIISNWADLEGEFLLKKVKEMILEFLFEDLSSNEGGTIEWFDDDTNEPLGWGPV